MGKDRRGIMSKRKTKKQKQQIVKYESSTISQEPMIEIQAEAYYRALKRIEDEKAKRDEQKPERRKYKWYEEVLFCINVFFWPWKISKRFSVSNKIYDSIPVMFVSGVLRLVGGFLWLAGLVGLGAEVYSLLISKIISNYLVTCSISLVLLSLGSIFILAGGAFEKETDSNKIYAYSASIIALVSCIVSIIALLGM